MAVSAGSAYVDVFANLGPFKAQMAKSQATVAASSSKVAGFAKAGLAGAAVAIGAIGVKSVTMAADFEKSMRNVNSIAQLPEAQFKALNDQVLDLAGETAQAPTTLAEGLYDLVSSGFNAKQSMKVLAASAKAATAGLTTTEVSAKTVSAVLNAYRMPASQASKVSDILFKTVDQGVVSFEELSSTIGKSLPIAQQLGVPVEDLGASIATLTKQGFSGAEANTAIRGAMVQLIKPTEGLKGAFKELGVTSGQQLVKQKGYQGALEALVGTTNGGAQAVGKMFTNQRALSAALAVTGKNAEGARKDVDALRDSTGATDRALEEQQKSFAYQSEKLKQNISAIMIRIGTALLPILTDVVSFMNTDLGPALQDVGKFFEEMFQSDVVQAMIPLIVGAFNEMKIALKILGNVIGVVTSLLRGDFAGAWRNVKELVGSIAEFVVNRAKMMVVPFKVAFAVMKTVAKAVWGAIKGTVTGAVRTIASVVRSVFNSVKGFVSGVFHAIADVARDVWGAIKDAVSTAVRAAGSVVRSVLSAMRGVASAAFRAVLDAARSILNGLASIVRGAVSAAVNVVKGLASAMFNAGRAAMQGLLDGITSLADDIANKVSDIANDIKNIPGKILDMFSPSKVMFKLGEDVSRGWALGIENQAALVADAAMKGMVLPAVTAPVTAVGSPIEAVAGASPAARTRLDGPMEFVIVNWDTGRGYFRRQAAAEIKSDRRFQDRMERMRERH